MANLEGKSHTYVATDGGTITDAQQRDKMLGNFMAPRTLSLKLNSQVMLIKNMDETLVNGSMGKVIGFSEPTPGAAAAYEISSSIGAAALGKKAVKEVSKQPGEEYPVVEFLQPGGYKRKVLMTAEVWKVELPSGEVQVSRTQVILSAACLHLWANRLEDPFDASLGNVNPQVARSNSGAREG